MQVLICTADVSPCPAANQQWVKVDQAFTPGDLGIDAAGVAQVAGWGVGAVLLMWSFGYGIGAALKLIRMV